MAVSVLNAIRTVRRLRRKTAMRKNAILLQIGDGARPCGRGVWSL